VIATLLGKRPSLIQLICVLLSVSGVIYIVSHNMTSSSGNLLGLLLLFLSALSFASYAINIGRILSIASLHELTILLITVGFIVFNLIFIIQTGNIQQFTSLYTVPFQSLNYNLGIIYLGFFASVLASLFSNYALKTLTAPQFSVFTNLSTLISITAGSLILKEHLYSYHYIGGALILIGVIGTNISNQMQQYFKHSLNKKEQKKS
jgi:drug/metabolite transporter (DMT)-like permease